MKIKFFFVSTREIVTQRYILIIFSRQRDESSWLDHYGLLFQNIVTSTKVYFQSTKIMTDIAGQFHAYIVNNNILNDRFNFMFSWQERTFTRRDNTMLMLALTYNRSLPNIVTHKNWDIFSINKSFKEIFKKKNSNSFHTQ